MNRRQYLSVVTAGATICFSGCTGFFNDDVELLGVALGNMQSKERTLSVRITNEGEIIDKSTHELPQRTLGRSSTVHGHVNRASSLLQASWREMKSGLNASSLTPNLIV